METKYVKLNSDGIKCPGVPGSYALGLSNWESQEHVYGEYRLHLWEDCNTNAGFVMVGSPPTVRVVG